MVESGIRWAVYPHVAVTPEARLFIERVLLRGRSSKTVDAYARAVDHFLGAFTGVDSRQWLDADEGAILLYLDALKRQAPKKRGRGGLAPGPQDGDGAVRHLTGRMLSDSTLLLHIVAIRQFYDCLIHRHLRADPLNPVPRGRRGLDGQRPQRGPIRRNERLPWTPPDDAWERFMTQVITRESPRNRAMLVTAYSAALRREELVSLRVDDIDWSRALITIRAETTKSGRMRHIPISGYTELVLREYLEGHRRVLVAEYGSEPMGPIFLSESYANPGQPLSTAAFNAIVQHAAMPVGLPLLTPHTLRHQRCTILHRAGVSLDDIALMAGHRSTQTTRLYIHVAPTALGERLTTATAAFDAHIKGAIEKQMYGR